MIRRRKFWAWECDVVGCGEVALERRADRPPGWTVQPNTSKWWQPRTSGVRCPSHAGVKG